MSDHIRRTIADLQKHLAEDEQKVIDGKRVINKLSEMAGLAKVYPDQDLTPGGASSLTIRSDQFYGQPLAPAIRQILEMRKALDQGPATINEIYSGLEEGGFAFDTKNADNAKRGLRISISKNTPVFHKLPGSGRIGLREWYPNIKAGKGQKEQISDDNGAGDTVKGADEEVNDVT